MNEPFQLFNKKTGKKLADSDGSAIVFGGRNFNDQYWRLDRISDDICKIVNVESGRWLAICSDTGWVCMYRGRHYEDQCWKIVQYPGRVVKLLNKKTGQCLAESSITESLCVFTGSHYEDQLWEARPDVFGALLARTQSRHRHEPNSSANREQCVICLDHLADLLLVPCGHIVVCASCGRNADLRTCPICRLSIEAKTHVFPYEDVDGASADCIATDLRQEHATACVTS